MTRPREEVLERNVRELLRRAYVPARPAPGFRGALRREFLRRAEGVADAASLAPRRPWPRILLVGGALAAAGIVLFVWLADLAGPGGVAPLTDAPPIASGGPDPLGGRGGQPPALAGSGVGEPGRRAAPDSPPAGDRDAPPDTVEPDPSPATGPCAVRVHAVDAETGAPLSEFTLWTRLGAELPRIEFARSREGRAGVASAADLERGPHAMLVEAAGYAAWRTDGLALEPGVETELEARLDRGVRVRGEVRDARTGLPIAGALVVAELDGPQAALSLDAAAIEPPLAHAITDAAGRYTIPHLSRRAQRLRVLHADYAASWSPELAPPARNADSPASFVAPTVELSPGGSLEGWVEDAGGAPASGAEVFASLISMERTLPVLAYLRLVTDAEGRFLAEHLPPGFYVVVANGAGGQEMRQVTVEEDARSTVRFEAARGRPSLRGILVGSDGAPRPRYQVAVVPEGPDAGAFEDWVVTLTDDEGRFVFEALEPGPYGVYADRHTTGMTRRDSVEIRADRDNEIRVVLADGVLEGRIDGGEPDAMLILIRSAAEGEPWVFHAKGDPRPDGSYRFDSLPPGRYRVALVGLAPRCGGYLSATAELLSDETVQAAPLEARPGVQVQAVTRTASRSPIAGAVVLFFDEAGDEFPYHPAPVTDPAGRAPAPSLRAGRWSVEASAPGYATVRREIELDPANGAELEVPLTLEPR